MAQEPADPKISRFWIVLIGVIILLIFLSFYQPFEDFVLRSYPNIHFNNVIFWFVSLVGVIGFAIAHWQSYRRHIFRDAGALDVDGLVFDTLQIAILVAVIFCAGATLQAVEMLGEHLIGGGAIIGPVFGRTLLAIILLVILAVLFYLLHHVVRAFRVGWRPRRPPRVSSSGPSN